MDEAKLITVIDEDDDEECQYFIAETG